MVGSCRRAVKATGAAIGAAAQQSARFFNMMAAASCRPKRGIAPSIFEQIRN
jgi:hypothetical protein